MEWINIKVHFFQCLGVIEFLRTSRIAANHPDFKDLGYKQSLNRLSFSVDKDEDGSGEYTHAFKLSTAYSADVMPFTNYTLYVLILTQPIGILNLL